MLPLHPSAHLDSVVRGRPLGSVARRSLGFLADTLISSALVLAIAAALRVVAGDALELGADGAVRVRAATADLGSALTALAGFAYFVASWSQLGATPGQWLLGLAVADVDRDTRLSGGRAALRWCALGGPLWIGSVALPGVVGLGCALASGAWMLLLLWSTARAPTGRGLHDRWARSRVVRVEGQLRPAREAVADVR